MKAIYYIVLVLLFGVSFPVMLSANDKWQRKPEAYWQPVAEAKGAEKIKLLNKLAIIFINTGLNRPDSALYYAKQSMQLSQKMGDLKSYARTAELCGNISLQLSQVDNGLTYYRIAARLAEKQQHGDLMAASIRGIGTALWYSGKFNQAIDTIRRVMRYFREENQQQEFADATMVLSSIYGEMGNYEKAFEVAQESLKLSRESGDFNNIILSLVQLGFLYKNVGDYQTAMNYFQQGFAINPPTKAWCYRHLCNRVGDLYTAQKKYDSAYYFYSQSLHSHSESKTSLLRMADYWLATSQYQKSETLFRKVYDQLNNTGEGNLLVFALIGLGKTAIATQDWQTATSFGYKALAYARQRDTRLTLRDAYELLYQAYDGQSKADSAYVYYKKFVLEKDAVVSDQFKGKIFAYKQESQIQLLASEKLMAEQELAKNRLLQTILLAGIFFLLLFGLFIFWNLSLKRKNEKLKNKEVQAALKQRAAEMEMQALRAQMNPHFIFNALSSVNRFILKNDAEKASDYLTRFSRLIRLVLVNSQRETISLEEELEMLRLYLQMEQLRFNNAFDFSIHARQHAKLLHGAADQFGNRRDGLQHERDCGGDHFSRFCARVAEILCRL